MPCRWKSKGFSSGEDCVAKMRGKVDNPDAFCYGPAEDYYRHPDFEKIYRQFLRQIKDETEANKRYFDWVDAYNLDETRSYGQSMREKLQWNRHADFRLWKEDSRAKYWEFEAGFALESMNHNVYTEQELMLAARTLKGKPVNLNHKFSLPTVSIEAADWDFEDNIVKGIMRVPKNLMCPICDKNKTINNLMESKGIYCNSLEAKCEYEPKIGSPPGICEGMYFDGLSLLTVKTLPGIPLTRMLPLEHIMVEALSSTGEKKMPKRLRIKAKVKEQEQPAPTCPDGEHYDITLHKCVPDSAGAKEPPIAEGGTVDVPQPPAGTKPDAHGQCPEGQQWSTLQDKCVDIDVTPEQVPSASLPQKVAQSVEPDLASTALGRPAVGDGVVLKSGPDIGHQGTPTLSLRETTYAGEPGGVKQLPHTIMPGDVTPPQMHAEPLTTPGQVPEQPIEPQTIKDVKQPKDVPMPEGDTSMHPTGPDTETPPPPHECGPDHHWDDEAHACVPDTDLNETVRRIKAEYSLEKARQDTRFVEKVWQQKYSKLDKEYRSLLNSKVQDERVLKGRLNYERRRNAAVAKEYENRMDYERRRNEALNKNYQESEIARREVNNRFIDLEREKRKAENACDDFKLELEETKKKYHGALGTLLQQQRQITKEKEDYLKLAKDRDTLKDAVAKARINAKKTLKIKA